MMFDRRLMFMLLSVINLGVLIWQLVIENRIGSLNRKLPFATIRFGTRFKSNDTNSTISNLNLNNGFGVENISEYIIKKLPSDDNKRLIDLYNFTYQLPQAECTTDIKAIILVHSATFNEIKRQVIRRTWGKMVLHNASVRLIFLVGKVISAKQQSKLEREYAQFGDLLQGTFIDNYRNLTYKHVMAFKWFVYSCPRAKMLIKVDDDVFVNIPLLLRYMTKTASSEGFGDIVFKTSKTNKLNELLCEPKNLLFCERYVKAHVKRTYRSKWRVSFREYSAHYYPPYCPGYAIIYSSDVIARLYVAAQRHTYFWIDDVHITGTLAQECNINITDLMPFIDPTTDLITDDSVDAKSTHDYVDFLFAIQLTVP